MRARTVYNKAYIFDFDDTLVKTTAKIRIIKNGREIKQLTPAEFNFYKLLPGESLDLRDFNDPLLILQAKKFKMWPAMQNISNAIKMNRTQNTIYILTARSPKSQLPIFNLLKRNNIEIELENIITIGNDTGEENNIPLEKERVLRMIADEHSDSVFYDDSPDNIELANRIPGIKTRLVDWNK